MTVNLCATVAGLGTVNRGTLCRSFFGRPASLALDPLNLSAQPVRQSLFHFYLASGTVQIVHRQPLIGQRNEAARHVFAALLFRHELRQQAAIAWVRAFGIAKVRTDRRIFKDRRRSPRRPWGTSVAPVLQEAQFEP